jgi:hypothetical protein
MEEHILQMEYQRVPKVLMLGNGVHQAFGLASWESLLKPSWTRELTEDQMDGMEQMPPSLRPVVLTEDGLDARVKELSRTLAGLRASPQEEELLKQYASLPIDAILTTNDTYALEKAVDPAFQCKAGRRCRWRKQSCATGGKYAVQQLHTYFACGKDAPPIWHIHGEAARPNSVILEHEQWGKLMTKMQQYLPSLIARYNLSAAKRRSMKLYSWLDYFMLGEVHMVGVEMALADFDLWWLARCKKRHFPECKTVLYKPDVKPEERLLAETYGVTVEENGFFGHDKEYYALLCAQLEKKFSPPVPPEEE